MMKVSEMTVRHPQATPYRQTRSERSSIVDAWYDLLNADEECPLNVRLEITLKQRRSSDLAVLIRDPAAPPHVLRTIVRRPSLRPAACLTVRTRSRVVPMRDAASHAAAYYLTEDETRRIASRLMNRLNKAIFRKAANRKNNPRRLTALICQHDRKTRRHLHALFAVPSNVPIEQFKQLLREAMKTEPFIARIHNVELIENVSASIAYDIRDDKTLTDNSVLYVYPAQPEHDLTTQEEAHDPASINRHRCIPPRAA